MSPGEEAAGDSSFADTGEDDRGVFKLYRAGDLVDRHDYVSRLTAMASELCYLLVRVLLLLASVLALLRLSVASEGRFHQQLW